MVEKKQFSLKWMLIEVALLAISFAFLRWCFFTNHDDDSSLESLLMVFVGLPAGIAFFGAAVGGLFDNYRRGAIYAVVSVIAFYLLGSLFLPTVTY
jgi:hypothetical protein